MRWSSWAIALLFVGMAVAVWIFKPNPLFVSPLIIIFILFSQISKLGKIRRCAIYHKNSLVVLIVFLITFLNGASAHAAVPQPVTGPDVIENFTTPRTFTDGMQFGTCNALTLETEGSPTLAIVNNSYLQATSNVKSDGFIIRSTNPLPATYKVTVDMGDIDFDLINQADQENGVYLPTISVAPGFPNVNQWWHLYRKVHMDIDNNVWGSGGQHPIFFGYYNPDSVTASDPADGQLVYDSSTNSWVLINTKWASAFNYQKNTWYTFELEKTTTNYFFRIYDAISHTLLKEASIPIVNVRSGPDYLAIGDPHINYYNGSVKIANLRITNITCSPLPVISSFTANPSTAPSGGGAVVLSWTTTGAATVSLTGMATNTAIAVNPTTTTTYNLTATNSTGSVTAPVTVTVPTTTPPGPEIILIEAENAQSIVLPFRIGSDALASNGKYIYTPNFSGNAHTPGNAGATYTVNLTQGGTYVLSGRALASDTSNDSFFVQIDNGPDNLWDLPEGPSWQWSNVNDQTTHQYPVKFNLTPGSHTIKIKLREDGTKLDELYLTNDVK